MNRFLRAVCLGAVVACAPYAALAAGNQQPALVQHCPPMCRNEYIIVYPSGVQPLPVKLAPTAKSRFASYVVKLARPMRSLSMRVTDSGVELRDADTGTLITTISQRIKTAPARL